MFGVMTTQEAFAQIMAEIQEMETRLNARLDKIESKLDNRPTDGTDPVKAARAAAKEQAIAALSPEDRKLFDALRTWRREKAAESGNGPMTIALDKMLLAIATERPTDGFDLASATTLKFAQKYSDEIVKIVREHDKW